MHSQASYWFYIGFKQMVCTVATYYWFLALLWFFEAQSFLSVVERRYITTGSLLAQVFSIYINNYYFSIFWEI
jgi:hypothetical protein